MLLKSYRCSSVVGDRYSGEWVREAFSKEGIYYKHSELTKSECYLESLPLFSQGVIDLLDVPALTMELMQLERRTSRSGKDSVDHPPQGRDDPPMPVVASWRYWRPKRRWANRTW